MSINNIKMKIGYFFVLLMCVFAAGCKKQQIASYGNEIIEPPADTLRTVLYTGTLIGGEFGDKARGDVSIEKVGQKFYLQFTNFTSYNGPDLHVYLSKTIGNNAMPPLEYKDLGFVKYLSGAFNYELPGEPDVNQYKYVLIWCAQYRIQFGYAGLK